VTWVRTPQGPQDPVGIPEGQSRGWQGAGVWPPCSHVAKLCDNPLPAPDLSPLQEPLLPSHPAAP